MKIGPPRMRRPDDYDELIFGSGAEEVAPNEAIIGRKLKPDG